MQTKSDSFKEVIVNTLVGLLGAIIITRTTFHFVTNLDYASLLSCGLCTVWSIFRSYQIRRYFENRKGKQNG